MSIDTDIRAALETHVAALPELPEARRFDGQPFTRPRGQPWARIGVRPRDASLAAMRTLRRGGTLSVEVFMPVDGGRGMAEVERIASAVVAHLRPGSEIAASGSVRVRVVSLLRGAVEEAADTLRLPVTAEYICDSKVGEV